MATKRKTQKEKIAKYLADAKRWDARSAWFAAKAKNARDRADQALREAEETVEAAAEAL